MYKIDLRYVQLVYPVALGGPDRLPELGTPRMSSRRDIYSAMKMRRHIGKVLGWHFIQL